MKAGMPSVASLHKRALALLVDSGPLLLLVIFGLAIVDARGGDPVGFLWITILLYVAYHAGFNLTWDGQTPGRRVMEIRLVDARDGGPPGLAKSAARPIVRLAWIAAFVAAAVLAKVKWLAAVPIFVDLSLVSALRWRQSTADFLCGTLVIDSPSPQAHRALAGPMYSATDAEFGMRPPGPKSGARPPPIIGHRTGAAGPRRS